MRRRISLPAAITSTCAASVTLGDLIRQQQPDEDGNAIPPEVTAGSYSLRAIGDYGKGALYEGKLVIDKTSGHATYGCMQCCGSRWTVFDPGSYLVHTGDGTWTTVMADNTCSAMWNDVTYSTHGWGTTNSSVAVAYDPWTQGVSSGFAYVISHATLPDEWCSFSSFFQEAGVEVQTPPVTIIQDTMLWYLGGIQGFSSQGATQVTLTAEGSAEGTFEWIVSSGSDKATFANNATYLQLSNNPSVTLYSKKQSDSVSDTVIVHVSYTPPTGPSSQGTRTILVESPHKLVPFGSPNFVHEGAGSTCATTGTQGYRSFIVYEIRSRIYNLRVHEYINETFSNRVDYVSTNWDFHEGSFFSSDGLFADHVCVTGPGHMPLPAPPPASAPYGGELVQSIHQTWYVGSPTPGLGVSVQFNLLNRWTNRGEHQGVTSPTN